MRYSVGDAVVTNKRINDPHRKRFIPKGTSGTVTAVMAPFKFYWVDLVGFGKTYLGDHQLE